MAKELATAVDTINALMPKANEGDRTALAALRTALAASPEYRRQLGDLGEQARLQLIAKVAGKNRVVAEVMAGQLDRLRRELAGPTPTPLESLLVDRICLTQLALHRAELAAAHGDGQLSIRQADYHQRTIDRAQRRHLGAIKALAEIRRLPLPALQINVAAAGGRQLNVAS